MIKARAKYKINVEKKFKSSNVAEINQIDNKIIDRIEVRTCIIYFITS